MTLKLPREDEFSGASMGHGGCLLRWREGLSKAAGKEEKPLSPIAIEVVRRIDALFEIECSINGKNAAERLATRRMLSALRTS